MLLWGGVLVAGLFVPVIGFGFLFLNLTIMYVLWHCVRAGCCRGCCLCPEPSSRGGEGGKKREEPSELKELFTFQFHRHETFWPIFLSYRRTLLGYLCASYPSLAQ